MNDEKNLTDAELEKRHGDHRRWSIRRWREEIANGGTDLDYIDWRADRLWCAASGLKD